MQLRRRFITVFLLAGFGLAFVGCQTTPEPPPPPPPSEFKQPPPPPPPPKPQPIPELKTIYFDFDKSMIRSDMRPLLRANAEIIRNHSALGTVTIQGHCDERGSEEYNLGLGDRRARSVRDYLVDLGVPASRIRTVTFGESKPAVMGHDESAWRWNRRGEFVSEK